MNLYSFILLVSICFCIIYTGYVLGSGIDEQYQLDSKWLKICQDFIEDPDGFCANYDEMMRTT